jgi:transposase
MSTVGHYLTDVSDAQWEVLQLLLPPSKWRPGGPGRKPMALRCVLNGIFYVNKTGCQWRMSPTNIGNAHTIYGYFRRWRRAGSPRGFLALHTSLNKRPLVSFNDLLIHTAGSFASIFFTVPVRGPEA